MRWILTLLLLAVVALPVALVALVAASLEDRPSLTRVANVAPEQVERAKRTLAAHDPRKLPSGVLRTFSVPVADLDAALNALLAPRGGASKLSVSAGAIAFACSLRMPPNPFGAFLNVEAQARPTSGLPELERLQIGRVRVPSFVADWLLVLALGRLNSTDAGGVAGDVLQSVRIDDDVLQVEYRWRDDVPQRLRAALVSSADQERLRAYHDRLVAIAADTKLERQVSLVALLRPLLQHAAARAAGKDPAAENRAAILVLTFYVNGRGLAAIVPNARDWPRPRQRKVTLANRGDLAQHFTVSAALAATAGTPLSDAIGLYKEIEDSRGGSGFSFADLAADRAGTKFGEHSTRSPQSAMAVQRRLGSGVSEADVMPSAADLPEMMQEAEFKRRYGGVGEPKYQALVQQIERRIAALSLYRPL